MSGFSGWPGVGVWESADQKKPIYEDTMATKPGEKNVRRMTVDFDLDENRTVCYRVIDEFEASNMDELIFPPTSRETRKNLHVVAKSKRMLTKSWGRGYARHTVITKTCKSRQLAAMTQPSEPDIFGMKRSFNIPMSASVLMDSAPLISLGGLNLLGDLRYNLDKYKLTDGQVHLLNYEKHRETVAKTSETLSEFRLPPGRPQVPPCPSAVHPSVTTQKLYLPACNMEEAIVNAILSHRVLLVTGHTGCGKTTQVPQFILEYCRLNNEACRVVCTQPRRIAAVTVAERVASERGESVGVTVGYHIRMEKKIHPKKTLLHFCTSGVLLRTLAGTHNTNDDTINQWTHVILDEAHEREKMTDFLLCTLRMSLEKQTNLRLIIMSATLGPQIQLFTKYFEKFGIGQIEIPSRMYDVEEYYLDKCLQFTGLHNKYLDYVNGETEIPHESSNYNQINKKLERETAMQEALNMFVPINPSQSTSNVPDTNGASIIDDNASEGRTSPDMIMLEEDIDSLSHVTLDAPKSSSYPWHSDQTIPLQENGNVTTTALTQDNRALDAPVSVSPSRDAPFPDAPAFEDPVSDSHSEGFIIADAQVKRVECAASTSGQDSESFKSTPFGGCVGVLWQEETDPILKCYYDKNYKTEYIDHELICRIVQHIFSLPDRTGAILVFLPGFEDISNLKERLEGTYDRSQARIFTLHSQVVNNDQQDVFKPMDNGVRKIILSTNIAEASVTIDDVVYVIDTGKMKEKNFDVCGGFSSLKTLWISKSNATQRKGRAGRTSHGIVFRCYSKLKYACMEESQKPEILRTAIHEICLNCKPLAPEGYSISQFLLMCPEPPDVNVIEKTLNLLKRIEALDKNEELTELGLRLLDLPVSPQLGKVLLHAVTLKCLDPVLMLVASISNKDPFSLAPDSEERERLNAVRKELGAMDFSDHVALLEVCCKFIHSNDRVCRKYSLSYSAMKMMDNIRGQLYCILVRQGLVDRERWTDVNLNSHLWPVVKAALVAGLYPHIAVVDAERNKIKTSGESNVRLHPSVMFRSKLCNEKDKQKLNHSNMPSPFLVFNEMNMTAAGWSVSLRGVTCVSPITVAIFAGPSRLPEYRIKLARNEMEGYDVDGHGVLVFDDYVALRLEAETCKEVMQLRQHYQALFLERMMCPNVIESQVDKNLLGLLVRMLVECDAMSKLYPTSHLPSQSDYMHWPPPRNVSLPCNTKPAPSLTTLAESATACVPKVAIPCVRSVPNINNPRHAFNSMGRGAAFRIGRQPAFGAPSGSFPRYSYNNPSNQVQSNGFNRLSPIYPAPSPFARKDPVNYQNYDAGFNRTELSKAPESLFSNGHENWRTGLCADSARNRNSVCNRVFPVQDGSRSFSAHQSYVQMNGGRQYSKNGDPARGRKNFGRKSCNRTDKNELS